MAIINTTHTFLLVIITTILFIRHVATANAANPLSPKASLLRYWSRKISNHRPIPAFLLSKASPLSAPDAALYSHLLLSGQLPVTNLRPFCTAAHILCPLGPSPSLDRHGADANYTSYADPGGANFTNYGTKVSGGFDTFSLYSEDQNTPIDTFRRYSRGSHAHSDAFHSYKTNGNVATANFTSYATGAKGRETESGFTSYDRFVNVAGLRFTNYDAASRGGRERAFSSYADDTNSGVQSFAGYGKGAAREVPTSFSSYGNNSNVVGSGFTGYGAGGAASPNDTFATYGFDGNVPENTFRSYADSAKGASAESFKSYRDEANVGDDDFQSYAEKTKGAGVEFARYGQSANVGSDTFRLYGQGAEDPTVGFRTYGLNNTFKEYTSFPGVNFAAYAGASPSPAPAPAVVGERVVSGRAVNRWVEPGKFFRESQIEEGTVMPMPDMRDTMPARSFLPRSISSWIPFSTARLRELNRVFNITPDTALGAAMASTVAECERKPSRGETKRCATSIEDMIDFATAVLGDDVVVRSMASTRGWGEKVAIGRVRGINGGNVTRSVSCHQSLFPCMVHYCHSVPKVRLYEAEIMALDSEEVINHGVAICHLDTSDWSPGHGAFVALGPGPGRIEVCHWIFEGDMVWVVRD